MGYRSNRLDEPVFMAGPKPMLTEFGIHQRLESCGPPTFNSNKYKDTRKSNPFHGFLNGLTPVCLLCVPALIISSLRRNFTAFQLNDLHYYLYAGG